jgi:hypothetical protein
VLLSLAAAFTPAVSVVEFWLNPDRADEQADAIVVLGRHAVRPLDRLVAARGDGWCLALPPRLGAARGVLRSRRATEDQG